LTREPKHTPRFRVRGTYFDRLQDAVIHAREYARNLKNNYATVPIIDNANYVVVAVVTDDANSLTVHRLATWPTDEECAY
jgi:hypothetical protein